MYDMENVTLNQREQARLQVLNSLLAEHMTMEQASTLMGVSTRHTRRILAAYRKEGSRTRPPVIEVVERRLITHTTKTASSMTRPPTPIRAHKGSPCASPNTNSPTGHGIEYTGHQEPSV